LDADTEFFIFLKMFLAYTGRIKSQIDTQRTNKYPVGSQNGIDSLSLDSQNTPTEKIHTFSVLIIYGRASSNMQAVNTITDTNTRNNRKQTTKAERRKAILLNASESKAVRLGLSKKAAAEEQKTKQKTKQKSVSFDKVDIRFYERTVGNNCCSSGAPITIGWRYKEALNLSLDKLEAIREQKRVQNKEELRLSRQERRDLLLEWDIPLPEIAQAMHNADKIQRQRRATIQQMEKGGGVGGVNKLVESISTTLKLSAIKQVFLLPSLLTTGS
jgi:hypothetical protein